MPRLRATAPPSHREPPQPPSRRAPGLRRPPSRRPLDPVPPLPRAAGLLDELALDGPAWRTPASLVLQRSEAFVAEVARLGLEGVVVKRLDSRYTAGRRTPA